MAGPALRRPLTGVLLVGGESRRFGGPKALALFCGDTLAARGRRVLAEVCDEVFAVGKRAELGDAVDVDDGAHLHAPLAGVVAGLRAARNDVVVFLPVDCPLVTPVLVRELGEACRDAGLPQSGPLPGAWSKSALSLLERRLAAGELSLRDAARALDVAFVEVDEDLLADADTPSDLVRLEATRASRFGPS